MRKLLLSLLFIGLAGCTSIAERVIEKPKVALDKVNVSDVRADGATILFGVLVDNPNPFALMVDSVKYDVEIGGKHLSSGVLDKGAQVAAKAQSIIEIPVAVKYSDVFTGLSMLMNNGKSNYRLKGEAAVGLITIPFDHTGELKLKK